MELETLKDIRTEPLCRVCGQPESRHADLMPLHPFEARELSAADRETPPAQAVEALKEEPPAGA